MAPEILDCAETPVANGPTLDVVGLALGNIEDGEVLGKPTDRLELPDGKGRIIDDAVNV